MLIVAGDAHIGSSPALGRLDDQRRQWEALCRIACEHEADVVGAGDFLHSRKPTAVEIDSFQSGLRILREGGRTFVSASGNHEITTVDAPSCLEAACAGFDAHVIRGGTAESLIVETTDGPVGFLPWTPWASVGGARMAESLMVLAEAIASQGVRTLIAHWAIAGSSVPSGLSTLELQEPLLDPHALASMFELTLAGHIHRQQEVVPGVWHAGPLCWRDIVEAQGWTGYWEVADRFTGPVALPDRRFLQIDADVRGQHNPTDALLEEIDQWQVRDAIVRVRFQQTAEQVVNTATILATLADAGAHRIDRIEPIVERVSSTRSAGVTESTPPTHSWDQWQAAQGDVVSPEISERVREEAHQRIGAA